MNIAQEHEDWHWSMDGPCWRRKSGVKDIKAFSDRDVRDSELVRVGRQDELGHIVFAPSKATKEAFGIS